MACSASPNRPMNRIAQPRLDIRWVRGLHRDSAPKASARIPRTPLTHSEHAFSNPLFHIPSPTVLDGRVTPHTRHWSHHLDSKTPPRAVSSPRAGGGFRPDAPSKCGDRRVFVTFATPTPPARCISSRNRPKASRMHSPVAVAAARSKSRGWEITMGGECHGVFRATEACTDPNEHGNLLIWDPYTRPNPKP